jgi:hypothetical protein
LAKIKVGVKRAFPKHLATSSQPGRKVKKQTADEDSVSVAVKGPSKKVVKA